MENWTRSSRIVVAGILLVLLMEAIAGQTAIAAPAWTITQLTNNSTDDDRPAISGTNVVWRGWDGSDWEIYSNFAGRLTNNSTYDFDPAISGTNVVWYGWSDSSAMSIYSNFAGQLDDEHDSSSNDGSPAISGTNVVWVHGDGFGNTIDSNFGWQLTDSMFKRLPVISGTNIAWQAHVWEPPSDPIYGIFSNFAGQLSTNAYDDYPDISGTNVVWHGGDALGRRINSNFGFQTDGGLDMLPAISGMNVAWTGYDAATNDYYIGTNFGGRVITGGMGVGAWGEVDISGTTIVWVGFDGSDTEIYMATYSDCQAVPLPGAALLSGIGAGLIGWLRRRRTF